MSRTDTDALIDRLVVDAAPVTVVAPVWRRVALWLALAVPPLVVIIAVHGLVLAPAALVADRLIHAEQLAALVTAIAAAAAAFASTIPGLDRRWRWLPAIPLAVWLALIGKGCFDEWVRLGPEGLVITPDFTCFVPMMLMATVPAASMLVMLRRGAPLAPRATLLLGALATAALVAFGLRFFHAGDATISILVWHMGFVALFVAATSLAGRRALRWPTGVAG